MPLPQSEVLGWVSVSELLVSPWESAWESWRAVSWPDRAPRESRRIFLWRRPVLNYSQLFHEYLYMSHGMMLTALLYRLLTCFRVASQKLDGCQTVNGCQTVSGAFILKWWWDSCEDDMTSDILKAPLFTSHMPSGVVLESQTVDSQTAVNVGSYKRMQEYTRHTFLSRAVTTFTPRLSAVTSLCSWVD